MFCDKWQPELIDYMTNARNGHKYDFKVSNVSIRGSTCVDKVWLQLASV